MRVKYIIGGFVWDEIDADNNRYIAVPNEFTIASTDYSNVIQINVSGAYTIRYELNEGEWTVYGAQETSFTADDDYVIDLTTDDYLPAKDGYQFDGWSGTDIEGLTNEVVIARHSHGTREYAAHWTATPPPQYPAYLDGAPDEVLSNYDDWAARYGYDPNGEHEAAFLLDVAPDAITNGVTPLVITELGTTNVVVAGSIYELIFQEVALAFGPEFGSTDYHMHNADEFYPLDEFMKHCVICTMGMLELAK